MAAPTVIMRPMINWSTFNSDGDDIAGMSNELAYILGGKSAGTIKAINANNYTAYTYNQLSSDITNHINRDGRFYCTEQPYIISDTPSPNGQIMIGANLPGSNDVYIYLSYYEAATGTLTFLTAATASAVPGVVSATEIHSKEFTNVHIKCFKITTSDSYIFVSHRIASASLIRALNVHFFRGDDAYVFDQANDKIAFSTAGKDGEDWATFISDIPYTPYSGSGLLVPYYYDDNADIVIEMSLVRPDYPGSSWDNYGYIMVFQFDGQHYGPAGVNLWDDETMSERQSKMFTENVIGIWRPGQKESTLVLSHTRAKSGTDNDGYNASLAVDTAEDVSYVVGILSEMWSINTDINPAQSGQESPVINLDYSYV